MDTFITILPWLVVACCIFAEAFFAASELSIVSANRIKLEELARQGDTAAERVLWFREQPDRLFGTTLLGTNFSTVTGSTVASLTLLKVDPAHGEWWAMLLMSPLVLIGVRSFQRVWVRLADSIAGSCLPRYTSSTRFSPHHLLCPHHELLSSRRYRPCAQENMVSREELVLLMQPSEDSGEIEKDEREMISQSSHSVN